MQLSALTDAELVRMARAEFDPLTGTALELELLRRFEEQDDANAALEPIHDCLRDHSIDLELTSDIERVTNAVRFENDFDLAQSRALLEVLTEFDIDEADALRKVLERDAKLADVLQDIVQPLADLQAIVNPSTPIPA